MVDATAAALDTPREQSPVRALPADAEHRWRGRDVVFVDPLDTSAAYWWPAMIVPTDEIDTTMGCTQLGADEYLVKYFEDCKYSTVRGSELRVFDTNQRPYTDFAASNPSFPKDKAIRNALSFLKTGHDHAKFQWRQWQAGSDVLRLPFALPRADPINVGLVTGDSDNTLVAKDEPPSESPADDGDDEAGSPSDKSRESMEEEEEEEEKTPPAERGAGHEPGNEPVERGSATQSPSLRVQRTRDTTTVAPKRGRPRLAATRNGASQQQQQQQQHQKHQKQQQKQQRRRRKSPAADEAQSPATDPPQIQSCVRELEEVQEEYRFFRSLVRRSAKDLWLEMGNEWPPNLGTSTRFGKRRKVN